MWSLQDAKARFSAVVDAAMAGEPQEVSRRGRPAVVVVSVEHWARLRGGPASGGFGAHLAAIPAGGDADPFPRAVMPARDPGL